MYQKVVVWMKKCRHHFKRFLRKMLGMNMEQIEFEVANESFSVESVEWVSVGEYFKIEFGEPDDNGFRSEKRIPMIFISGKFGHREIIGVEPFLSQARNLKKAVAEYKSKLRARIKF